ncbi:MAG: PAP/fibrillin family protein, partial [Chroococcales cyanobacterium]
MVFQKELKEKLVTKIKSVQTQTWQLTDAPLTNRKIQPSLAKEIETLVEQLESCNPNYRPLLYNPTLVNGAWLLLYSTAREIRNLSSLPLGLKVGRVYQVI